MGRFAPPKHKSDFPPTKRCYIPGVKSQMADKSTGNVRPSVHGSTVLLLDLGRLFSFLILYTVGRTPWTGDQPVARPPPTHTTTQTQNIHTQTYIRTHDSSVPAGEDHAATVIAYLLAHSLLLWISFARYTVEKLPSPITLPNI
jgi:hypothetical protein